MARIAVWDVVRNNVRNLLALKSVQQPSVVEETSRQAWSLGNIFQSTSGHVAIGSEAIKHYILFVLGANGWVKSPESRRWRLEHARRNCRVQQTCSSGADFQFLFMDTWVAAVRQQEREVSKTSTREVQRGDGADKLATGCMERLTMLRF